MTHDFSANEKKALMERLALSLPVNFSDPVLIGRPPAVAGELGPSLFSATLTYLELGERKIGVTNAHVIRHYQNQHHQDGVTIFQLPDGVLRDLDQRLIDVDDGSDLATIDLSDLTLTPRDVPQEERRPRQFHRPASWPPEAVAEGDVVAYGGWPGALRRDSSDLWDVESSAYTMIGMTVSRAMPDRFNVKLDRTDMTLAFGRTFTDTKDYDFRGMSGGPVLRRRPLCYEFVGIISEYSEVLDQFVFTSAENIKSNGELWHNTRR